MTDQAQTTAKAPQGAPHFTADDFNAAVATSTTPVLVDFYADWCGPCKLAAPVIDRLAGEYQGKVVVAKLNVDDHNEVAKKFGVMSIPTVLVFNGGKEIDRKIGFPGEEGYRLMLENAVAESGSASLGEAA